MPRTTSVDPELLKLGQAFEALRRRVGVTQAQAADAAEPVMTSQYWGMHETGKVPGLFRPGVQRKLLDALTRAANRDVPLTSEDLHGAARDEGDREARLARLARELAPATLDPARKRAVFPTSEGDVVIEIPAALSPAGFKQLEAFFAVFLQANRPAD